MNEEITVTSVPPIGPENIDVTAIPSDGDDMIDNQKALIAWSDRRIALLESEGKELAEACEQAKKRKWKWTTLDRHSKLAGKRADFYHKMKAALEAGYLLVPNFDGQVFAIRRDTDCPSRCSFCQWDSGYTNNTPQQNAQSLATGEGSYRNPFPILRSHCLGERDYSSTQKKVRWEFWAHQWAEFEFPISMAKPRIIEATSRAMALRIFDELRIFPAHAFRSKRQDPIITGTILGPKIGYSRKRITFMIVWHLDTKTL